MCKAARRPGSPFVVACAALAFLPEASAEAAQPDYSPFVEVHRLEGHTDAVTGAAFSPDGGTVATISRDETARLWDASTGQLLRTIDEIVCGKSFPRDYYEGGHGVAFSPDGTKLATGAPARFARVWDVRTGNLLRTLGPVKLGVESIGFSPDGGRLLASACYVYIWDADSGSLLRLIKPLCRQGTSSEIYRVPGYANSAVFSPDGRLVATPMASDTTTHIWDASSGQLLLTLDGAHTRLVIAAAFSPDGRWIVTGSRDMTAVIWNVTTGRPERSLTGHTRHLMGVSFSPDGDEVATASADRTVRIWQFATGRLLQELEGHTDLVYLAVFRRDGRKLLTSSRDRTARIWARTEEAPEKIVPKQPAGPEKREEVF